MKKILGLDLGTNSIGWALIDHDFENKRGEIIGMGSRIIPMSQAVISDFERGITKSQTADRTEKRGTRRLYERSHVRRERIHRVLNILGFLPEHYASAIDFEKHLGQFIDGKEVLITYSDELDENGKRKFAFQETYDAMEKEFRENHDLPSLNKKNTRFKLPQDWTLYYLRKKALTQKISKQELAWILLNFNHKRGYFQEREETELKIKSYRELFETQEILSITDTNETYKETRIFEVTLANGIIGKLFKKEMPKWEGEVKDIIIKIDIDKHGNDKIVDGKKQIRFSIPSEQDWEDKWELIKDKAQRSIGSNYVGAYIYCSLLKNPNQKIKGKLVRTIDRDFYFDELEAILKTQVDEHPELRNEDLFRKCIEELYPHNDEHQGNLLRDKNLFVNLFLNDILFYHRPLKSQKNLISRCKLEYREFLNGRTNKKEKEYVKCMPKSHPLFQEFRIWQLMASLSLQKRETVVNGKIITNEDITNAFIKTEKDRIGLFDFLNNRKELTQKQFIAFFIKDRKIQNQYKWNYSDNDKTKLVCNETYPLLVSKVDKSDAKQLLLENKLVQLWHIIYSVSNKKEYEKAIRKFCKENEFSDESLEKLYSIPVLKREYGSYSEKAIKKLLPLMRSGKYWRKKDINEETVLRIGKLVNGEYDDDIKDSVREKVVNLTEIEHFQGLPLWLASYIVYGRYSEADAQVWETTHELDEYIKNFKQHSLRNPIVEQVLLESLRVTSDLWKYYGNKLGIGFTEIKNEQTGKIEKVYQRLFDKIHIEIGRDLKNPKKDREKLSSINSVNKDTNQRIRSILMELNKQGNKNVNPSSSNNLDKLKILEDGILTQYTENELKNISIVNKKTVYSISRDEQPSRNEIIKYTAWLEQKYRSPYTGKPIPLSSLFTSKYQIEHIIPQSKFLDNSFNNKVICESEVNSLKDNMTGYEFIQKYQNTDVPLTGGGFVTILTQEEYESFVINHYSGKKKYNLLQEETPKKMSERQKNDMRYISKEALRIYSNIVREEDEQESTSKNIIPVQGKVTAMMKKEWGLGQVWNELVEYRFKRLNSLICGNENEGLFGVYPVINNEKKNFFLPQVPIEIKKDFQIKRIDHRHHAIDALIVACVTRQHTSYISNQHVKENKSRFDLGRVLRHTKEIKKTHILTQKVSKHFVLAGYKQPWERFVIDAKNSLENIVISFKQNLRAINKTDNRYWSFNDEDGNVRVDKRGRPKKGIIKQVGGKNSVNQTNYSIRKQLHEDTYYGILENGANKGRLVLRCKLDDSFDEDKINKVSSSSVRKILLNHLNRERYLGQVTEKGEPIKPEKLAFSPEGIEDMNKRIIDLNDGKFHHPIYKARVVFEKGNKFPISQLRGSDDSVRLTKYVKAASGTNLYFCIYKKDVVRKYNVPSFEDIVQTQKDEVNISFKEKKNVPQYYIDEKSKEVYPFLFYLQPNDLVFVPKEGEDVDFKNLTLEQTKRIYKCTDGAGTTANFIPMLSASVIFNLKDDSRRKSFVEKYNLDLKELIKNEYGLGSPQLKSQNTVDGTQIKLVCWKLEVDRLGNIVKVTR